MSANQDKKKYLRSKDGFSHPNEEKQSTGACSDAIHKAMGHVSASKLENSNIIKLLSQTQLQMEKLWNEFQISTEILNGLNEASGSQDESLSIDVELQRLEGIEIGIRWSLDNLFLHSKSTALRYDCTPLPLLLRSPSSLVQVQKSVSSNSHTHHFEDSSQQVKGRRKADFVVGPHLRQHTNSLRDERAPQSVQKIEEISPIARNLDIEWLSHQSSAFGISKSPRSTRMEEGSNSTVVSSLSCNSAVETAQKADATSLLKPNKAWPWRYFQYLGDFLFGRNTYEIIPVWQKAQQKCERSYQGTLCFALSSMVVFGDFASSHPYKVLLSLVFAVASTTVQVYLPHEDDEALVGATILCVHKIGLLYLGI